MDAQFACQMNFLTTRICLQTCRFSSKVFESTCDFFDQLHVHFKRHSNLLTCVFGHRSCQRTAWKILHWTISSYRPVKWSRFYHPHRQQSRFERLKPAYSVKEPPAQQDAQQPFPLASRFSRTYFKKDRVRLAMDVDKITRAAVDVAALPTQHWHLGFVATS